MKHYCRSAACEHTVMITGSINHCQPQLILSYLFLFCSIQVSRNIWQPSSLGRAKDQTVLLFIDSKLHLHSLRGSWSLQPEAALGHFGEVWGSFLKNSDAQVLKLCGNSAVKWSENAQVSNPKSDQNNPVVVTALPVCPLHPRDVLGDNPREF